MSAISDQLVTAVEAVVTVPWSTRTGYVVPDTDGVVLRDGAVQVSAAYLYADLAGSSVLAHKVKPEVTARIIRAFLNASSRIILHYGGAIRSFDGDRVMGIYMGTDKSTKAVRSALAISWAVEQMIKPRIEAQWADLAAVYKIDHGVGVATGDALIVRGGVRDNNDLISIGAAPNVAAKLSSLRGVNSTYITRPTFDEMDDSCKIAADGRKMFSSLWSAPIIGGLKYDVLASNFYWRP